MTRQQAIHSYYLLLFLTILSLYTKLYAQPGYKTFLLQEDNKPLKINALFKNHKGYLYTGTSNGLYKFDGDKFTRINFQNKDYNDTVTAIFQDDTKKMWLGFQSGRIANVLNGLLRYYNPEEGTPKKKITSFVQDAEHNIWYSSYGEGIYFIRNNHHYLINADDGLSDINISSLTVAGKDILAATDQGINICSVEKGKKKVRVIGPKQGLPDYIVTSIAAAGNNKFWIGLQDKGFCLYDHTSGLISVPSPGTWTHGQINTILLDHNILWIATQEEGLFRFSLPAGPLTAVTGANTAMNTLLTDNQGNIWFSSTAGLTRSPGEALKLFKLYDPALSENIHALLADKKGNVWINNKHTVNSYSMNGEYPPRTISLNGMDEKTEINSLYEDANNNIWIGTTGNGIFILDPATNRYRKMNDYPGFEKASILSISGRGNAVFISSLQGTLIAELSNEYKDINKLIRFTFYDNFETGTNYIYSIFRDSKGRTWFATDGKGLTKLEKGMFAYYNGTGKINDDHVYSITEDKKGNIWFSTGDAGVYKIDGKNFINYSLNEGLSDLNISALRTDSAGNIIIVNKKGFDFINPLTGNVSYVNSTMGIGQVNAEDLGAVTQDSAGNILVSSSLGIISITSASALQRPTTVIESVQLFSMYLEENAPSHFSYDENYFTFNYTGLYYTSPDQVYYRYKLDGFDTAWVITKDRSKTFAKLDPGSYTFRIQSTLNRNFKNADEAFYHFIIKKPFYKTYWFIVGSILLLAFLLYWYVKNRERRLKKMQRLNQEKIQFQFEVLRNQVNPHFLFNSFNTLISAIEDDPKMAVEYVEQLSDFFRNIVNYRDTDVITLKEEINLLETYAFLQQKRYGNNLKLEIRLNDEEKKENFIPPLTLQLLIENAIKHNVVSKEMPLIISVEIIDNENLVILNNKNSRLSVQAGAGMGLQNIINRFRLLSNKNVNVINDEEYFKVELPLIKKML